MVRVKIKKCCSEIQKTNIIITNIANTLSGICLQMLMIYFVLVCHFPTKHIRYIRKTSLYIMFNFSKQHKLNIKISLFTLSSLRTFKQSTTFLDRSCQYSKYKMFGIYSMQTMKTTNTHNILGYLWFLFGQVSLEVPCSNQQQ